VGTPGLSAPVWPIPASVTAVHNMYKTLSSDSSLSGGQHGSVVLTWCDSSANRLNSIVVATATGTGADLGVLRPGGGARPPHPTYWGVTAAKQNPSTAPTLVEQVSVQMVG